MDPLWLFETVNSDVVPGVICFFSNDSLQETCNFPTRSSLHLLFSLETVQFVRDLLRPARFDVEITSFPA